MVNSDRIISEKAEKVLVDQHSTLPKKRVDIREYTVSVGFEGSETGSSREIASLHDTT